MTHPLDLMKPSAEENLSTLTELRKRYEFWIIQYRKTQRIQYYALFQRDFAEYRRLIDSGAVAKTLLDKLADRRSVLDQESPRTLSKRCSSWLIHEKLSRREAGLLALFVTPEDKLSIPDIQEKLPLSTTYLREVLESLVDKGRLKKEKNSRSIVWRKSCS